jgi:SmpA / OmlA family
MTNDEHLMTKGTGMTNIGLKNKVNFPFELRHSFGIRHLSFVIFPAARLVLVLLVMLFVSCSGKRITKANVDEVAEGMSKKQVESILGAPTSSDNEVIMKKATYVYRQDNGTVTIVFKDDKVQSKDSTLAR